VLGASVTSGIPRGALAGSSHPPGAMLCLSGYSFRVPIRPRLGGLSLKAQETTRTVEVHDRAGAFWSARASSGRTETVGGELGRRKGLLRPQVAATPHLPLQEVVTWLGLTG
jgi:hypothetical protein